MKVEIPFKAVITYQNQNMSVQGAQSLLDLVSDLRKKFGENPTLWPVIENPSSGHELLINELILKLNYKFSFVYPHEELCHCRNVATESVYNVIKEGQTELSSLMKYTMAGTGCGSCRKDIESLIQQFKTSKRL